MSCSHCAACGMPAHRYGRNDGMERFDPMACINTLRGEVDRLLLREALNADLIGMAEGFRLAAKLLDRDPK